MKNALAAITAIFVLCFVSSAQPTAAVKPVVDKSTAASTPADIAKAALAAHGAGGIHIIERESLLIGLVGLPDFPLVAAGRDQQRGDAK